MLIGKAEVVVGRRNIASALTPGVGAKRQVCSCDGGRDMAITQLEIVACLEMRTDELAAPLDTASLKGCSAKEPDGCADTCGLHEGLASKLGYHHDSVCKMLLGNDSTERAEHGYETSDRSAGFRR